MNLSQPPHQQKWHRVAGVLPIASDATIALDFVRQKIDAMDAWCASDAGVATPHWTNSKTSKPTSKMAPIYIYIYRRMSAGMNSLLPRSMLQKRPHVLAKPHSPGGDVHACLCCQSKCIRITGCSSPGCLHDAGGRHTTAVTMYGYM